MPRLVWFFILLIFFVPLRSAWCLAQESNRSKKDAICDRYTRFSPPSPIVPNSPDEVAKWWTKFKKHMLVVHPTETGIDSTKLEFSKVNATFIADKLSSIGFEPINGERILEGSNANYSKVVGLLNYVSQEFSDNSIVLIYYCGHAVITGDGLDLELELYRAHADPYSANRLRLRELIEKIRNGFKGELILILDACHSGQARINNQIANHLSNTIILSSSDAAQKSYILKNKEGSAYSQFFVDALSGGWELADNNRNGMLEFHEINDYIAIRLGCAADRGEIEGTMDPLPFSNSRLRFIAYNPNLAKNWDDPFRTRLMLEAMVAANLGVAYATEVYRADGTPALKGVTSYPLMRKTKPIFNPNIAESAKLAKSLPNIEDPLIKAMQHIERGEFTKARFSLEVALRQKRWPDKIIFQMQGVLSLRAHEFHEALKHFRQALVSDPEDPAVWLQIADVLTILGEMDFARSSFDAALLQAEQRYGLEHLEVARVLEKYVAFLLHLRGGEPAIDDVQKARALRERSEIIRRKAQIN